MKKTLVALAALATVGAAFAQSSVTLYGRIDASVGSQKTTVGGVTTADVGFQLRSGAHTGSRWGMRGSEDLGGGLKANFQLEQGFSIDTGAANNVNEFNRAAWVGVSGGFGSLSVGRQYDIVDTMYAAHDAMGYSGFGAMGFAFNNAADATGDDVVRQNNSFLYAAPNMGGLALSAMWAPGENKAAGVSAGRMAGVYANYANGPLGLAAGWQSNKATGATPATTNVLVSGMYDLGMAKLYAQLQNGKNKAANAKDNGFSIGAVIPLGTPSLMVSYADEDTKVAGVKTSNATAFSAMLQYPLSKRTYVYAALLNGEVDPTAAGALTTKQRNYGLGLVHNF